MYLSRSLNNRILGLVSIITFLIIIVCWFLIGKAQIKNDMFDESLDGHWNISINDTDKYEDMALEDVNFGSIPRGSVVEISRVIPEYYHEEYTMGILVYLCSVEAYVDNEKIYDFASDIIADDIMVGSGYHFITLPAESAGKMLYIKMVMNEDNAFSSVIEPKVAPTKNFRLAFAMFQRENLFIGCFLVLFGFILLIVSSVATCFNNIYRRLVYIGLFAFLMGVWSMLSNKTLQIFEYNYLRSTELEYITLYIAPVPICLLFYDMRKDIDKWRKVILGGVCYVISLFFVSALLLHANNIVRLPQVLLCFHIISAFCLVCIFGAGFVGIKDRTSSDNLTVLAVVLLMLSIAIDLFRFNIQKYVFPNNGYLMNSFISYGTVAFVVLLLISYLMYLYDMAMTKTEKEMLTKLAYNDVLTGLQNRASYEIKLEECDIKKENFALISFDVNGLKQLNDGYGHNKGDLLLVTFAHLLLNTFGNIGYCYRTGGDEFAAIVEAENINKVEETIEALKIAEEEASKENGFSVVAAYGVAYLDELQERDSFLLFRLSDHRMYEMKSEMKGIKYEFGDSNSIRKSD